MSAKKNKIVKLVTDGWMNILTGLGMSGQDKKMAAFISWERMDEQTADDLYAASDIAATICDELPAEAFRQGYDLDFDDADDNSHIEKAADLLHANLKFEEAWSMARKYGGSAIIVVTPDANLAVPLNEDVIPKISSLLVVSMHELRKKELENDIRHPNFGLPRLYTLQTRGDESSNQDVHWTRVIRFEGSKLSRQQFIQNQYWDDSILTKCLSPIRNYDTGHDATATLLQDLSIAVHKIKGLNEMMLAEDGDSQVQKRLQVVNLTRSVTRSVVIDSEGEDFVYQSRSLTGIAEAVKLLSNRLVVASKMPHTKILGESPSGLGATGNSEARNWNNFVSNRQEQYLKPKLIRFYTLLLKSKQGPTKGQMPSNLNIIFRAIEQLTDKEMADARKVQADTDNIYITNGVLDPITVAKKRFGTGSYSFETNLDQDELGDDFENEIDLTKEPNATPGELQQQPKENLQQTALNGAQVTSLVQVMSQFKSGALEFDSAKALIKAAFPMLSETQIVEMLGDKTGKPLNADQ